MLKCRKCKENKDCLEFYKKSTSKTGYQNICKECGNIEKRNWRANNPDKAKKWDKNRVYSPEAKDKRLKKSKERNQLYRDIMTDEYIAGIIHATDGIKIEDIPKELIHLTRVNLRLKRACNLTSGKYNKSK